MHVESFVACIVGKMPQDVGMVWKYHSHLVWLVFESFIPTCTHFRSENFLCLVSDAFLGMVTWGVIIFYFLFKLQIDQ